jgi:8-oxo-dGTP diphosphatase
MAPLLITSDVRAPVGGFHRAVSALMIEHGRVLMVRRGPTRAWAPDRWDLPGGHVEQGETEHDALVREAREELGVTLLPDSASLLGRLTGPNYDVAYYAARAWSGCPRNAAPLEHTELAWVAEDELSSLALADPSALPIIVQAFR